MNNNMEIKQMNDEQLNGAVGGGTMSIMRKNPGETDEEFQNRVIQEGFETYRKMREAEEQNPDLRYLFM